MTSKVDVISMKAIASAINVIINMTTKHTFLSSNMTIYCSLMQLIAVVLVVVVRFVGAIHRFR